MTIKMHFSFSYLDQFSENVGNVSDENGERFQEDIQVMEDRYQGHSNINMMADCCWGFKKGKLKKKQKKNRNFQKNQSCSDFWVNFIFQNIIFVPF